MQLTVAVFLVQTDRLNGFMGILVEVNKENAEREPSSEYALQYRVCCRTFLCVAAFPVLCSFIGTSFEPFGEIVELDRFS